MLEASVAVEVCDSALEECSMDSMTSNKVMSWAGLESAYPPETPANDCKIPLVASVLRICTRKRSGILCRRASSRDDMRSLGYRASSTIALSAYVTVLDSFTISQLLGSKIGSAGGAMDRCGTPLQINCKVWPLSGKKK